MFLQMQKFLDYRQDRAISMEKISDPTKAGVRQIMLQAVLTTNKRVYIREIK